MSYNTSVASAHSRSVEISSVLRNTYMLLGMTLVFSAAVSAFSIMAGIPHYSAFVSPIMNLVITFGAFFGLLFAIEKTKNSPMGLILTFVFTGFLGYSLTPLLNVALAINPSLIMVALGGTGLTFFSLSAYVLMTKKDMSFLSGAITTLFVVAIICAIASFFLQIPAFSMAVSGLFMIFSSLVIMWQTSAIIHGGERNYISATVTLFVSIYNIFSSLLHLLLMFTGGDD